MAIAADDSLLRFLESAFGPLSGRSEKQESIKFRVVRRSGVPFLLLPANSAEAVASLSLYSAQSSAARIAKAGLRVLLQAGLPFPGERLLVPVSATAPFVEYLSSLGTRLQRPSLGILAGNPNSPGQRFVLLCFNEQHEPVAVVKAGCTARARDLIEHEIAFLSLVPEKTKGISRLLRTYSSGQISALAMPFYEGKSPQPQDEAKLPLLMKSWIDSQNLVAVADMPAWSRLNNSANPPGLQSLLTNVGSRKVHPCISHGDFVPWNAKTSKQGDWTVLDWERGELVGIPGWDWFHYLIQPAILVRHERTSELVRMIEALLETEGFKRYASLSEIAGMERELVLAYLGHFVDVIRPSEGIEQNEALLSSLMQRWGIN